jgi:hypothetical protein
MRTSWGSRTFASVYPRLPTPATPRRRGPDGSGGGASARPSPARLWLLVALCLLCASAAPPAAGAEQASTPSLVLAYDQPSAQVGEHRHLIATLSSTGQDTFVKYSLPQGLNLLSADPSSASLGTWLVPPLGAGMSAKLDLLVEVTAPGAQTTSVAIDNGPQASATIQAGENQPPVLSKLSMKGRRFRFTLSEPATLSIAIQRTADRHTRFVQRRYGRGSHALRVTLGQGTYRATFIPTDALGKQGRARHVSFRA